MAYTNDTIDRYLYGGDLYGDMESQYGVDNADYIAALAASGDPIAVATAVNKLKNGEQLQTGFWSILGGQVSTDVTAAPANYFNDQFKKIFKNLFTNPWLLIALVAVVFFALGGFSFLKRQLSKK